MSEHEALKKLVEAIEAAGAPILTPRLEEALADAKRALEKAEQIERIATGAALMD